jgi:branched-chain amino acid transport system permease protein
MQVIGGASYGLLISYLFLIVLLVFNPRELIGGALRKRKLSAMEVQSNEE